MRGSTDLRDGREPRGADGDLRRSAASLAGAARDVLSDDAIRKDPRHPAAVGGFVWSSIIALLSEKHRVYALDTIGDSGRSELADPDRYPKKGRDYSAWLEDVYAKLAITHADVVAGSMGGWIAMNHAIYAPDKVRRLVLLGPMGLPPWRATLAVLIPFAWYALRPTEAKFDRIIFRALGEGERVNREFRPWMRLMGKGKARVGQPIRIPDRKLRTIKAPTLVILGGKDGLVGSAAAAAKRARNIPRLHTYYTGCAR